MRQWFTIVAVGAILCAARPAQAQPRPSRPGGPGAEEARKLEAEVDRLKAHIKELESKLSKEKDAERRPEPRGERRPASTVERDRRPAPPERDGFRDPEGRRGPDRFGPPGGPGGFGPRFGPPGRGFGDGERAGPPRGGRPGAGPGERDGRPPEGRLSARAGERGGPPREGRLSAGPGGTVDIERKLDRIIQELEQLRTEIHRSRR